MGRDFGCFEFENGGMEVRRFLVDSIGFWAGKTLLRGKASHRGHGGHRGGDLRFDGATLLVDSMASGPE
jgi:hypothetical protein